jgi:fatty acyl-CoA reductase
LEKEPKLKIKEFFKDKKILLTGCTGFLGKVLVEKILRSIPQIGKIYLLVRGKRNMNASERLLDILSSRLFSVCKKNLGEEQFMKMALEKI